MKCQEVIELIQRHLDQELTEEETVAMHNHMEHCDECAGMFARMAKLSEELVSLPKVAPAFSLVDQILPRLQEIDELRNQGIALDENGRPLNEPTVPERRVGFLGRIQHSASIKTAGGIAAAAVLLLVVFAAIQPIGTPLDNAGEARLDDADRAGANGLANHAEAGDVAQSAALTAKSQVVTSGGQSGADNDASSGQEPAEGQRHEANHELGPSVETPDDNGVAFEGLAQDYAASGHDPDESVTSYGEPGKQPTQQGRSPLGDDEDKELFALQEPSEESGKPATELEPGMEEQRYAVADYPVATSSVEVQRLDSSLSDTGELTAYVEESGGMYRLAVYETATGAALYVGAFMEMEDVPQLVWSTEEEELVFMRYRIENESYRLAVNARAKSAENIRE
ncbi:zf-HC2 domain-containing protein [Xylanibacillus composti]|uniref:Putative zinc-finger domain-containing protein n=1 Tax=Xylanibacillus composti TaxID=1572762 RepID=A0A8J4H2F3_9BACL|nr:zf-HC2 domain-containing protein [Xylanibacillus composti]MDT9724460.1 zf-HC2 domain-containing protein [Xylanibacillus composti]GIQ69722.1 hypothetical protein XYCOK13_25460 [Xylanibacillus composti]